MGLRDLDKFHVQPLADNRDFLFGFKGVHVCSLVELPHNNTSYNLWELTLSYSHVGHEAQAPCVF